MYRTMRIVWHKTVRSKASLLLTLAAIDAGVFWGAHHVFPPAGGDLRQWLGSTSTVAAGASDRMRRGSAQPLDIHDAAVYRAAFAAQRQGNFTQAEALMRTVGNDLLAGPVLYQRYTDARYRPSFAELKSWLDAYADQPGAGRIYRMALDIAPSAQPYLLALPSVSDWANSEMRALSDQTLSYQPAQPRPATADLAVAALRKTVRGAVRRGDTGAALGLLKNIRGFRPDHVEYDQMRAEIAHGLYNDGHYAAALDLATACLARSGDDAPEAAWVTGLIAWRNGHYFTAADNFELVAQSPQASAWTVAAGAYWAARSYRKAGAADKVGPMLAEAAAWPRTFYGLIASRMLGRATDFDWQAPVFTKAHAAILSQQPAFRRAVALRGIGEFNLAERHMLAINPGGNGVMREALIAYAQHAGMPALSMRLAGIYRRGGGHFYDAALYPLPAWQTGADAKTDTALTARHHSSGIRLRHRSGQPARCGGPDAGHAGYGCHDPGGRRPGFERSRDQPCGGTQIPGDAEKRGRNRWALDPDAGRL